MHMMIKSELTPKDLRQTAVSSSAFHPHLLPPSQEATAWNFSLVHSLGTYDHFSNTILYASA